MDRRRFARLQELFDQALDRPEAERCRFIDEACADDPELGVDLRRLLRAGKAAGGGAFMASAVRDAALGIARPGTEGDGASLVAHDALVPHYLFLRMVLTDLKEDDP